MGNNKCNNQYFNLAMEYFNRDTINDCTEYIKRTFPNGNADNIAHAIDCVLTSIAKGNHNYRKGELT